MFSTILPLLLATAPPSAAPSADTTALDAAIAEIFRPYSSGYDNTPPWERPIFSAEATALIAHWRHVLPEDEPDRLNDGDWLCQCQDYDAKGFKTTPRIIEISSDGLASAEIGIDLGFSEVRDLRKATLILRREGGAWKLDEIVSADAFPRGLKQALRETIAEDEALRAKTGP
ncbi:MAG TPA: DUF3828 domain-containing protein [Novosphingobium sp.]|nr:DUF3828 domain-containing protein [Novosphingobium sp.]